MNIENAQRTAKEMLDRLSAEMEKGHSDTLEAYLQAMAKFPRYSLHNTLLILSHVCGLRSWNRLGRSVRRGEHGIRILAPVLKRRHGTPASAPPVNAMQAEQDDDAAVVAFRIVSVFDIAQTDGAPLDLPCVTGDPGVFTERLKKFAVQHGVTLEYSRRIAPARGACIGNTIVLLPDLSSPETISVLAHELGHFLLHRDDDRQNLSKTVRETEAEAVAFVVCEACGLDARTAANDYIQLWHGNSETLAESLVRIQRTAAVIISAIGPDV